MIVSRTSRACAYLGFHSRPNKFGARHVCGPTGSLCKYSSLQKCRSFNNPSAIFYTGDYHHQRSCVHSTCSTSEIMNFQDVMHFRRKQAQHSVLVEISTKNEISSVLGLCKQYGEIKNMIFFLGNHQKFQVIAEFAHEESVRKMLSDCSFSDIVEAFPCQSRFLYFDSKGRQPTTMNSSEIIDLTLSTKSESNEKPLSVSEMMIKQYKEEKMSDLSARLRFLSCALLQDALSGMFPHCAVFPFGSTVNGFGKDSSDLDMMLRLFPEQTIRSPELFFHTKYVNGNYRELQRRTIFALSDILQVFAPGVSRVKKIPNARVPIVEYHHDIFGLDCDVSVNNMAAVYMSEVLFFCGELDPRVRPLVYTIKKWAKEAGLTYDLAGSWVTNFTLTLLVVFFLQTRPIPVLPPLNKLVRLPSDDFKPGGVEYLIKGDPTKDSRIATVGQNTETLEVLLYEFVRFLADYPFDSRRISVVAGTADSRTDFPSMCIDYPLDESLNVCKNVSMDELQKISKAGAAAARNLEKNLNADLANTDLMSILGISVKKQNLGKIDVRTFMEDMLHEQKVITGAR